MTEEFLHGQLAILQELFKQGILTESQYRERLLALGVDPTMFFPPDKAVPLPLSKLRQRLAGVDDVYIDRLALDNFPQVYDKFSEGMRRDVKINLLLDHCRRNPGCITPLVNALDCIPASRAPQDALNCYLDYVIQSTRRLKLQGIRSSGQLVSISLEEVYVPLTLATARPVTAEPSNKSNVVQLMPFEASQKSIVYEKHATEQPAKIKVRDALAQNSRLVVLGDPGSGKTTLLRYLALTYARDLSREPGLVAERLGLSASRLPVLLPLRDFARYLERHHPDIGADGPKLLLDYLYTYFVNQDIILPERFFANRLRAGECIVLLDGVDEVAKTITRQRIARIVEKFTLTYPDNRMVVTSRIVGYATGSRLGVDYVAATITDFTQADIEHFVTHWNLAIETLLGGGETPFVLQMAQRQTEILLEAISRNERVRELAVNPLLLTVIALVQRYRAQLPERRTELYEEAIEVLLGKWDEAKGLTSTTVLRGVELDAGDRRSLLEPVALWMMEHRLREIDADELRRQLGSHFYKMTEDWRVAGKAVDDFLRLINERSGLLTERGQGVYAFSHLTFQEHLAARAIADRKDYIPYTLACLGDSWWREVILLEAGYLSTQGKQRVTELIRAIMNHEKEPEVYHNLLLAAEALRDAGPARVEGDLWGEVQRRLRQEFEMPLSPVPQTIKPEPMVEQPGFWQRLFGAEPEPESVPPSISQATLIRRRAAAAEALARIEYGTSGTRPAFWRLPYGEPVWVDVPAGQFWMGSEKGAKDEKPVHQIYLARFWIARVPVTNMQYRLFVAATGHAAPEHWTDGRIPKGLESHPVVNVSWYDAQDYCKWLSEVTGGTITLPSEAQWEKAARGDKDWREYPWGYGWDAKLCNNDELGLNETTPVGIFPQGQSPYGCLDMVGNVWEWTRSIGKPYPYVVTDGREDMDIPLTRVLRGGSFNFDHYVARCAFRGGYFPYLRLRIAGFRVIAFPLE